MLPHESPSRGLGAEARSFGTGAYAKGPLQGLRKECGTFPQATKLLNAYVCCCFPDHTFTTSILFCNAKTDMHVDSRNHKSANAVMGISSFENGQIWVGDGCGPVAKQVQGRPVLGRLLEVAHHPARFDAWKHPHCTEDWQGKRLVLVAFAVKSLSKVSDADLQTLTSLGFRPPADLLKGVVQAAQESPPLCTRPLSVPWVFEIFSGKGQLSRALWSAGFRVLSVDAVCNSADTPTARLNVSQPSARQILWDLLAEYKPYAVHIGAPCSTVLPKDAAGALRSKTHPLGLPLHRNILVSLDNPANSFLWHILAHFASVDGMPWPLPGLETVLFHNCCHGGPRPTQRRVVATVGLLRPLAARCQKDHPHEPWGRPADKPPDPYPPLLAKRWTDCLLRQATAASMHLQPPPELHAVSMAAISRQSRKFLPLLPEFREVIYMPTSFRPDKSCKILLSHESAGGEKGASKPLQTSEVRSRSPIRGKPQQSGEWHSEPATVADGTTARIGQSGEARQSSSSPVRRKPQQSSERHSEPATHVDETPGTRSSARPAGSTPGTRSSARPAGSTSTPRGCAGNVNKVGFWFSPKEHLERAKGLRHPMDTANPVADQTQDVLERYMSSSAKELEMARRLSLLKVRLLVRSLEKDEAELHKQFPPWYEKVVASKKILTWKKLLEEQGYDDIGVTKFLLEGCPLVGTSDLPDAFDPKIVPAKMTEEELRLTSQARRKAMSHSCRTMEAEHVEHLKKATTEEVERGFLDGPFTEEQVSEKLGTTRWSAIRRFVLVQGAELKLRPIDDCAEAQLNDAYTSTIKLRMMDSDYVSALALRITKLEAERAARLGVSPRPWVGKTLDLTKAYKQLPILPAHRDLCVILVADKDNKTQYYIGNALVFGATSAVFSFNRVARSLWFLISKLMQVPSCFFFDDYPMFCLESEGEEVDRVVSDFLGLLGWDHATSGSKGLAFSKVFTVLGMQLDLSQLASQTIVLSNKPGRTDRIVQKLQEVAEAGNINKHEAQVLRGLLQFASGFYAGRGLKQTCCWLGEVVRGKTFTPDEVRQRCAQARKVLASASPRFLRVGPSEPLLHLYTDGSWEGGVAGIGAVLLDMATGAGRVFQGVVNPALVQSWLSSVGEQLICEIELYALVAIRHSLGLTFEGRRCIYWIDNNAARSAVIKGHSTSPAMLDLTFRLSEVEALTPCASWIERVPSFSNIADYPSRQAGHEILKLAGASSVEPFPQDREFIQFMRGKA